MHKRTGKACPWLLAALTVISATSAAIAQTEQVIVARDGHGVAHVSGPSDEAAFFGAGWAHAEDRLFQMCLHRIIYQGRVAEFLGAAPAGGTNEYIQLDRYHRRLGWTRHAALEYSMLSPELRGLLDAFAEGVTAYMAEVRAGNRPEHPLFSATGLPLNEDWTAQDSLGLWIRLASNFRKIDWAEPKNRFQVDLQLSQGKTQAQILAMLPGGKCDDSSAVVQPADVSAQLLADMSNYAAQKGLSTATNCSGGIVPPPPHFSHAWAVSSAKVVEGVSVLASDPRLPLGIPNALYEWHMIGDTFDVRGAGAPGVPYFLVGSNDFVAWGATALGPDQADMFKMDVDLSASPSTFTIDLLDGAGPQALPMVERRSEIKVAQGPSQFVVYRETYYGPMVTEYVSLAAQQTLGPNEGYALKALPWSHLDRSNFQGYLDMYRSTDVGSFRLALDDVLFPAINSVFSDSAGSIGYVANGGFPVRANGAFLAGYVALDGTTVANDWQELLPHDFKPWVIDPADGTIFSANHQPIGSFYPLPFVSGALGEENRSWRLRQLLDTGVPLTIQEIADIHLSAKLPSAIGITEVSQVIQTVDTSFPSDPDAQAGLAQLISWTAAGGEMTNAHPATSVASNVDIRFPNHPVTGQALSVAAIYGGKGLIPLLKVKLAEIGLGTFTINADEKLAIELLLAKAYRDTLNQNGQSTDPLVWQANYQAQNLTDVYTLGSGLGDAPWTVPDSYPSAGAPVSVIVRADTSMPTFPHGTPRCTEGGTIMEQAGQSYTQFVIPGIPDAVLSVLTPGVRELGTPGTPTDGSANPASTGLPIDRNQEPLWSGIGSGAATDLKWFPTTSTGVLNFTGGFLSVDTLVFTP